MVRGNVGSFKVRTLDGGIVIITEDEYHHINRQPPEKKRQFKDAKDVRLFVQNAPPSQTFWLNQGRS